MKTTSVDLFLFDTRQFTYDELVNILKIDKEDAKRLQKFACEEVRKEKLVSLFYKQQFAPDFYTAENGKPLSNNLFFNVSHSKGMVVFAMNEDRPIGVDIELIRPVDDNLKRYVANDEEYKLIESDSAFFAIWTSKESFAKCTGIGIKGQPKKIPALPLSGIKNIDGTFYNCKMMKFDNFVISITLEGVEDYEINFTREATI